MSLFINLDSDGDGNRNQVDNKYEDKDEDVEATENISSNDGDDAMLQKQVVHLRNLEFWYYFIQET